jgi:hypothetical protein
MVDDELGQLVHVPIRPSGAPSLHEDDGETTASRRRSPRSGSGDAQRRGCSRRSDATGRSVCCSGTDLVPEPFRHLHGCPARLGNSVSPMQVMKARFASSRRLGRRSRSSGRASQQRSRCRTRTPRRRGRPRGVFELGNKAERRPGHVRRDRNRVVGRQTLGPRRSQGARVGFSTSRELRPKISTASLRCSQLPVVFARMLTTAARRAR